MCKAQRRETADARWERLREYLLDGAPEQVHATTVLRKMARIEGTDPADVPHMVQDPPTEHRDPTRLACGCERAYGCSCYTRD